MAERQGGPTIKTYKPDTSRELRLRAGVIAFEDQITLVADERLVRRAKEGCKQANFVLAHELGHLGLNHHARGTVVKNFQLFSRKSDMANIPPTVEELEANYAAVFFQCGVALLDDRIETMDLAHRAFTDVYTLKKVRELVRLDAFKRELHRPKLLVERVVL
jgi:Zn-dependent peptidase ImmA (M78 family)